MKIIARALLAAGLLAVTGAAAAEDPGSTVGVSVEASALLGLGVSVGMPVGERFNVRASYHGLTYELDDIEDDESGATYEGELDLSSAGVLVDFHPFKGAFRLTAGLAANGNQINLSGIASPGARYEVGDCTFESDPADPLRVDGTVEFSGTVPYLGIGWGGNLHAEPGFYATLDLGVMLSGAPETRLSGRGGARNANAGQLACGNAVTYQDVSAYPEFQQAVQDAESDVDEETKALEYWPNIALGIGWRF